MARTTHARRWPWLLTYLSLEIAALAYGWMLSPLVPDPAPFIAWPRPPLVPAGEEFAYGLFAPSPPTAGEIREGQYQVGLVMRMLLLGAGWALVQIGRPPLRRRFHRATRNGWAGHGRPHIRGARTLFWSDWVQPVAAGLGAIESRAPVPRNLRPPRRLYWAGWLLIAGAAIAFVMALGGHVPYHDPSERINGGTITMPQLDAGVAAAAAVAGALILGAAGLLLRRIRSARSQIHSLQVAAAPTALRAANP